MYELIMMRHRGFESCPDPRRDRCERFFGVLCTAALLALCYFSTLVKVWLPSILFAYEPGLSVALRGCIALASVIGIIGGVLCIVSFVRVCVAHPGMVWYRGTHSVNAAVIAMPPPPASDPSSVSVTISDAAKPRSPADSQHREIAGGYYDAAVIRHCALCDRPKPPTVHHCRRCGTCIDRMDHHCPWIGQCVGRGNHKYFMLFLGYATLTGFTITATSLPNFLRFCSSAFSSDSTPSAVNRFVGVDFLMVVVFFIASMFAMLLLCFVGSVWDAAVDGCTQLDHARPHDFSRTSEENAALFERARTSNEYLKRWSLGRGSKLQWLLPTEPRFDEDSVSHV